MKEKIFKIKKINSNNLDDLGRPIEQITESEIWGKYVSIERSEFYASKNTNVKIDVSIKVRYIDFKTEDLENTNIEYDKIVIEDIDLQKKYLLERDFQKEDGEFVSLYLSDITQQR